MHVKHFILPEVCCPPCGRTLKAELPAAYRYGYGPSADSSDLLLKGLYRIGLDIVADSGDHLCGRQQGGRFYDGPLAVHPAGFNGIEAGTFEGQAAGQHADPTLAFGPLIVLPHPGPHLTADRPRGIVPDQHQPPRALSGQALTDPR
jgi:hypothetical protein